MIYIISNNRDYSDHVLYFVSAADGFPSQFVRVNELIKLCDFSRPYSIVATTTDLEWTGASDKRMLKTMSAPQFFDHIGEFETYDNDHALKILAEMSEASRQP